jgi:AcrR family transcriptional regulator
MKTKDKIIHTALLMFNKSGERAVTTNHIAAKLGISPGNLYYYFRNKEEIIRCIFAAYQSHLQESFKPTPGRLMTLEHVTGYLDAAFSQMWRFRFLYANLPDLLGRDEQLKADYLAVQADLGQWMQTLIREMSERGYLDIADDEIDEMAMLLRMVVNSWITYQSTLHGEASITKAVVYEGVGKVLFILKPYISELTRESLKGMTQRYQLKQAS